MGLPLLVAFKGREMITGVQHVGDRLHQYLRDSTLFPVASKAGD